MAVKKFNKNRHDKHINVMKGYNKVNIKEIYYITNQGLRYYCNENIHSKHIRNLNKQNFLKPISTV